MSHCKEFYEYDRQFEKTEADHENEETRGNNYLRNIQKYNNERHSCLDSCNCGKSLLESEIVQVPIDGWYGVRIICRSCEWYGPICSNYYEAKRQWNMGSRFPKKQPYKPQERTYFNLTAEQIKENLRQQKKFYEREQRKYD